MALKTGGIKLSLDSLSAAFSMFDDLPYSERELSDSFAIELMKKAEEAGEFEEVGIRVKKKAAKKDLEEAKKRFAEHFMQSEAKIRQERWMNRLQGTAFVILGGALLVARNSVYSEGFDIVGLLLLPAGWLALFLGAEFIVADWRLGPGQKAAKKLREASYSFSH